MKNIRYVTIALFFITSNLIAQIGKVGINTTVPRAMLHVKDSSVLFSGALTIPQVSGPTPVIGSGVRMLWYPDKAAFRAGEVVGNKWNRDSIGIYSFASGYNNVAFGEHAIAMGKESKALGASSIAIGEGAVASDDYDTAIGYATLANGDYSTALGFFATASGGFSTALGDHTTASGESATAMGFSTVASSIYSTAMGAYTTASAYHATAMGAFTAARGRYSSSMGWNTMSHGHAGLTIGMNNDTLVAPQQGYTNDTPLFIIGNGNDIEHRSNAMVVRMDGFVGIGANQPLNRLHVKAPSTNAQLSRFSSGGGYAEIVVDNNTNEVDFGVTPGYGFAGTKDALDFAIRTSAVPRLTIDGTLGYVGIGTANPAHQLHVRMNNSNQQVSRFSGSNITSEIVVDNTNNEVDLGIKDIWGYTGTKTNLDFRIRTGGFTRMTFQHETGNVGIGTTIPSNTLEVNGSAAKPGGGSWVATSDVRLKQNVTDYMDGLVSILQIRPVSYQYNPASGYDTAKQHIGIIAQELQQVAPYMVSTSVKEAGDGNSNYLEVDNSAMVYMLINAVQEQQAIIQQLEQRIDQLEKNE